MMRPWMRLYLLVGIGMLLALPARAQETGDGSIYSRFGLGELHRFTSPQAQAMGGGGFALPSYNYLNTSNPASWATQILTRASLGLRYENLEATDASDNTSRLSAGTLQAVHFSFPILAQKLGAGIAFRPYSRRNYLVSVPQTLTPPNGEPVPYQITYAGEGGLQDIGLGLGWQPSRYLSVGASGHFLFGVLEDSRTTDFEGGGFTDATVTESTRLYGFTGTIGTMVSVPRPFGERDFLAVGAAVTLPVTLDGERVRTVGESLNRDTLSTTVEGAVELPLSARIGASYSPSTVWTFVADALYEPWSGFASELPFAGYQVGQGDQFSDRLRVSGGLEVIPAAERPLAPYLKRVAYRIGFYHDEAYINASTIDAGASADLNVTAGTFGLSLPTMVPGTRIDLSFELGTRGTTDQNLVRDVFYGVSASVNFGERWFTKRKLR